MVKESTFKRAVKLVQEFDEIDNFLSKLGIEIADSPLFDNNIALFDILLCEWFDEGTRETIYWWMYEYDKKEPAMWDKDGNVIPLTTLDEFWNYLETTLND